MTGLKGYISSLLRKDTRTRLQSTGASRGALRAIDHAVGCLLAIITLAVLLWTPDMGFTRDEGFYFKAAKDYLGWFEELEQVSDEGRVDDAFTQETIDKHWSYNPEHPVLLKTSFALSYRAFSQERDLLDPSTAMRLPTMIFIAAVIWMMYLFMAEAFDRVAGLFAVVAVMAMPRFFWHAHLSCFDAAMVTMWFAVIWAYWKSLDSRFWVVMAGVFWGIALGTKLNAFFIPGVLLMHWAWNGWAQFGLERKAVDGAERKSFNLRLPKVPAAFFSMILIGPVIFYLMWPRHWFDTFNRIYWYFERHLGHEHYAVYYYGELLALPPFPREFPYVMSLVTIPLIILATFVVGVAAVALHGQLAARARYVLAWFKSIGSGERPERDYAHDPRGTMLLMILATWIPFFIISRPDTPIFGGVKHWSTAMPFFACFAGIGFSWAFGRLFVSLGHWIRQPWLHRPVVRAALCITLIPAVLWPAVRATAHNHPDGTAYYNELIGGAPGAADAQMHRQFWGYASRHGLDWLNENAPENASVNFHNTLLYSFDMYKEDGLVRDDIRVAWDINSARYVMYHHQRAFHPFLYEIWATYETTSPVYVATVDGVPVLSIYENPRFRAR